MVLTRSDGATQYVSREEALKRLTDFEAARVSAAEALGQLADGDEYLDLHHLDRGVRVATANAYAIGGVLPRKSIGEGTWFKLVAQTTASQQTVIVATTIEQRVRLRKAP